jgi:hypothetical protein
MEIFVIIVYYYTPAMQVKDQIHHSNTSTTLSSKVKSIKAELGN